jgi:hypothetical protein
MMVPMTPAACLRVCLLLGMTMIAPAVQAIGRGPQPAITIPLQPFGYDTLPTQFMLAGSSMLTVHFVDEQHLLLTYNTKRLLKRLAECPPEDEDRTIDALLLELPSGKVLARTEWRVHDRGQYLWSLGHGRFVVRSRNTLSTVAPLANLASGRPFLEQPIISTRRSILAVLLSPDADLMIVESREPKPLPGAPRPYSDEENDPVQVDFFRVGIPENSGDQVVLQRAGQIFARSTGRVPANSSGYVAIIDQGRQHWAFDYRSFAGKVKQLSPFESSCRPMPILVSRSEFIAFGCHTTHTQQVIGGFNLRGEEMWEQNLSDGYIAPMFVFAPAAGRFALSRLISHDPFMREEASLTPQLVGPQTVVVYQTDSGKQILRVDCSPIERAGQNFALSPDGLNFAVIRNEVIEIYNLPPLTAEEKKAVQLAKASEPEATDAIVHFAQAASAEPETPAERSEPVAPPPSTASGGGPAGNNPGVDQSTQGSARVSPDSSSSVPPASAEKPAEASTPPAPATGAADSSAENQSGDQAEPRKPPTIYTLPGEKPGAASSGDNKQPKQ